MNERLGQLRIKLVGEGAIPPGLGDFAGPATNPAEGEADPNAWIVLFLPGEDWTGAHLLKVAIEAVTVNRAEFGAALAVRVVTPQGVEIQPRAWPMNRNFVLGPDGLPTYQGRALTPLSVVDGVRINTDHSSSTAPPETLPTQLALPDPARAARAILDDPVNLQRWLDLLDAAVAGLTLVGRAVAEGYPTDAAPTTLARAAQTLRGLAGADLLRPADVGFAVADLLSEEAAAYRSEPQGADSAPAPDAEPKLSTTGIALASLGEALHGACFVPGAGVLEAGYGRALVKAGLRPVTQEVAATLLVSARPVLWIGYRPRLAGLGRQYPGLVHVLYPGGANPSAEMDDLGIILPQHREGLLRLWMIKRAGSFHFPTVTALALPWLPPTEDAVEAARGLVVVGDAVLPQLLGAVVHFPRVWLVGYSQATAQLLRDVIAAHAGSISVVAVPKPSDLGGYYRLFQQATVALVPPELFPLAYGAGASTAFSHHGSTLADLRPETEVLSETTSLLARAGFELPLAPADPLLAAPPTAAIALMADVPQWSFDINLDGLEGVLAEAGWRPKRFYLGRGENPPAGYWAYYCPYLHPAVWNWSPERMLGALRTQWFRPEQPGPPNRAEWAWLRRCAAFAVPNREALRELVGLGADPARLVCLTNPVDLSRFSEPTRVREIVAAWAGTVSHTTDLAGDAKGLRTHIVPACEAAGVPLEVAERDTDRWAPEQMGDFYRQASVYVCASAHEGASNSVMEAMASGLALVSTATGNVMELQQSQKRHFGGETGILIVPRSQAGIAQALRSLTPEAVARMGEINRAEIEARWSWAAWAERYLAFFRRVLG